MPAVQLPATLARNATSTNARESLTSCFPSRLRAMTWVVSPSAIVNSSCVGIVARRLRQLVAEILGHEVGDERHDQGRRVIRCPADDRRGEQRPPDVRG